MYSCHAHLAEEPKLGPMSQAQTVPKIEVLTSDAPRRLREVEAGTPVPVYGLHCRVHQSDIPKLCPNYALHITTEM